MDIPGYEIKRLVAKGGTSSVFVAVQRSLDRPVALKILRPVHSFGDPVRFLDEGRILASLNHANIITIHDVGLVHGWYYIAMEYLGGGSLVERIGSGVTTRSALGLLRTLADCLDFVHRKGIIHRDIKPANILFHADGTLKLTDFGIAKQLSADQDLTLDGRALGSPYYLSPEQAECKDLDGRSDIYSLGVVFYELLTGTRPFRGDSHIETILAHLIRPVPTLPPACASCQDLVDRMLAKDPAERFGSAAELADYLDRVHGGPPVSRDLRRLRRPAGGASRARAGAELRRKRASAVAVVGVLALLSVVAVVGAYRAQSDGGDSAGPASGLLMDAVRESADRRVGEATVATPDGPLPDPAVTTHRPGEGSLSGRLSATIPARAVRLPDAGSSATDGIAYDPEPVDRGTDASPEGTGLAAVAGGQAGGAPLPPEPGVAGSGAPGEGAQAAAVEQWLALAERALDDYRLSVPAGDSALDYYREVLAVEPDNRAATAGIARIADRYAALAERYLGNRNYEKTGVMIDRGLKVRPRHQRLRQIRVELEAARQPVAEAPVAEDNPVSRFFGRLRSVIVNPANKPSTELIDH